MVSVKIIFFLLFIENQDATMEQSKYFLNSKWTQTNAILIYALIKFLDEVSEEKAEEAEYQDVE